MLQREGGEGGREAGDPLTPNNVPPGMLMLEFLRVLRTLEGGEGHEDPLKGRSLA